MPIDIDPPSLGDTITLASVFLADRVGAAYDLDLESHRLVVDEVRGDYWYRFSRTYRAADATILGTAAPFYLTLAESGTRAGGNPGPTSSRRSDASFAILSAGRQNQRCQVPGLGVALATLEDLSFRLTASIPAPSPLLSTLGGYCRVSVLHPGSRPEPSPCTGLPDYSGQNIMAQGSPGVPMDGPFLLRPYVRRPPVAARTGSWVVFRPARVNWEYWNAVAGFGPVVRHEAYTHKPTNAQ